MSPLVITSSPQGPRLDKEGKLYYEKWRGSKRAALADGLSLPVIYYQMTKTEQEYQENEEKYFLRKDHGKVEQQLVQRLEHLDYQVSLPTQPVT